MKPPLLWRPRPSHPGLTFVFAVCALALSGAFSRAQDSAAAPGFERQVIDAEVEIGYGLAIGDVDGDGKPDILLADKRHFAWYHNPDWQEFEITKNLTLQDNVCIAAEDLDGDGRVEIAVGANWNPGETTDPQKSGSVHYLIRPDNAEGPWPDVVLPHDPTVHRMRWVRGDDGEYRLVVLPLHGIGNVKGEGDNGVRIAVFNLPDPAMIADPTAWTPVYLDESLHQTHNFDDAEGDVIVGGAEGILRKDVAATADQPSELLVGKSNSTPPTDGVGEVRVGKDFYTAVEPMHGNQLVVYTKTGEAGANTWKREVLTDRLNQGHALAVGNLSGDEREEIVVGWRKPDADGRVGLRIFSRGESGAGWTSTLLDDNGMACEDLKLADLDADGKLDIIAAGRDTHNLVIYWNRAKP